MFAGVSGAALADPSHRTLRRPMCTQHLTAKNPRLGNRVHLRAVRQHRATFLSGKRLFSFDSNWKFVRRS
jgi:hypothetical protein